MDISAPFFSGSFALLNSFSPSSISSGDDNGKRSLFFCWCQTCHRRDHNVLSLDNLPHLTVSVSSIQLNKIPLRVSIHYHHFQIHFPR